MARKHVADKSCGTATRTAIERFKRNGGRIKRLPDEVANPIVTAKPYDILDQLNQFYERNDGDEYDTLQDIY